MERLERIIEEEGLAELRKASAVHLTYINEWHDATEMLRNTPPGHPLHAEARRQYDRAVLECAASEIVLWLEGQKAERAWAARQEP